MNDNSHSGTSVMQQLYDSEIVKIGDASNGFVAEANLPTWQVVEDWLTTEACRLYPESVFSRQARS